jgi:hypothetical protein
MSNPSSSASQAQLPSAAEDFAPRRVTSIKSANFIVLKTFDYFFVYDVVTLISAARPGRAYDKRYHDQIKLIIERKIVVPSIGSFLL